MSEKMDELHKAWAKMWGDFMDAVDPTWFGRLARWLAAIGKAPPK